MHMRKDCARVVIWLIVKRHDDNPAREKRHATFRLVLCTLVMIVRDSKLTFRRLG